MANNTLTSEQRIKWRALYRSGWRVKQSPIGGKWFVVDEHNRGRSQGYRNRDHAVAEVTG